MFTSAQLGTAAARATPAPGTLDQVAARYLQHLRRRVDADDLEALTYKNVRRYLDNFLAFMFADVDADPMRLGALGLAGARQSHLLAWLMANFHRWKKGSTRADAISAVVGCFSWWADETDERPAFVRPRKLKLHREHFPALREAHYRAIQRAAGQRRGNAPFRRALFFAWQTGCRLCELRKLEWGHVDWKAGVVRDLPSKTTRRTGQLRIFGVGPRVLSMLKSMYKRRQPGQKHVFLTRRGRPWTKDNLGRRFAHYRKLAGLPKTVKCVGARHGFAVRLLLAEDSVGVKAIADQLGHTTTRMVESIYGAETRRDAGQVRRVAAFADKQSAARPSAVRRDAQTR